MTFEEFETRVFTICRQINPIIWIHILVTSCGYGDLSREYVLHVGESHVDFRGSPQEILTELQKYAENPGGYIAPPSVEAMA